jgi:hypothetical protein
MLRFKSFQETQKQLTFLFDGGRIEKFLKVETDGS